MPFEDKSDKIVVHMVELMNHINVQFAKISCKPYLIPFAGSRIITSNTKMFFAVAVKYPLGGGLNKCFYSFTYDEKVVCAYHMIKILAELESQGVYHRHLKLDFFVFMTNKISSMRLGGIYFLNFQESIGGERFGSPNTFAPEQLRPNGIIIRSKIMAFQLGCCLYELFTSQKRLFCVELSPKKPLLMIRPKFRPIINGLVRPNISNRWSIRHTLVMYCKMFRVP
jgi:serine/threonine protein kinase